MSVRIMLRLPIYALLALGVCGSASPADDGMGTEWLIDQYFGSRQMTVLPDLKAPVSVMVGVLEPGTPRPPGSPIDYRAGRGLGDVPGKYYPFLHSVADGGAYAVRYPTGDATAIMDNETGEVKTFITFARGPINSLHMKAVRSDMVPRLIGPARARKWNVAYSSPRCLVMTMRGVQPDQYFTSVFLGDEGPVWDLNDKGIERCALAGVLQAFGMDVPNTLARADTLYPHKVGLNSCPLAVASADAIEDRDWRAGLRCKSRARAAWPFYVLRHAAETGRLKAGPVSRADFAAAMAAAAKDLGEDQRRKILRKEDASLQMADQVEIPNPKVR